MRTWPLIVLGIAACGPIYSDPPARAPTPEPAHASGPPGGGADPWSTNEPGASEPGAGEPGAGEPGAGEPDDPYRPMPDDPYAAPEQPRKKPGGQPPKPAAPKPPAGLSPGMQAILDAHNRVRAQHCAPPLTWSPQLAQFAQQWANTLRDQGCKFGHSNGRYGENLAAGTSGTLDGKSVTDMWYDEIKLYSFAKGGFSMETGHFTQVVWRDTKQLGCAVTACKGMDIWVCEYDPPGNVQGQFRQNVQPKGCR